MLINPYLGRIASDHHSEMLAGATRRRLIRELRAQTMTGRRARKATWHPRHGLGITTARKTENPA
jgi:hypothetical protein